MSVFFTVTLAAFFCLILAPKSAQAEPQLTLTAEQQKLWTITKERLAKVYAAQKKVPSPMPDSQIEKIRIPLTIDKTNTGPLPWDVQLLLSFDRNLTMGLGERPIFEDILEGSIFMPDELIAFLTEDVVDMITSEPEIVHPAEAIKRVMSQGSTQPAVLSMPQIGGDELPCLWLAAKPGLCTPVLHFDYDDMPEFYIRSTSLFGYVLQYLESSDLPETLNDNGTDKSSLLDETRDKALLAPLEPKLKELNDLLYDALAVAFTDYE